MRRWPRAVKFLASGAAAAALLWLGGFVWFVHSSLSIAGDRTISTDAIVVLTGGRLRVETAIDLLGDGRAQKLFISGVNPHVDRVELLRVVGRMEHGDTSRIELGHEAENTVGNARETAEWMQQEGYRSLRLVTSWYHMRRSLIEFARAMPDTLIVAEPVFAVRAEPEPWSGWIDVALLTIGEYNKFLVALVRPGITAVWPQAAVSSRLARIASTGDRRQ